MRSFVKMWCAVVNYEGKPSFLFGNVVADSEEHARVLLTIKMSDTFPTVPNILSVIPGGLIFVPALEEEVGG